MPPASAPIVLQASPGKLLTVGVGMEFASLHDACLAATAGDTIAVQAGTYVNDFATTSVALKIVAVGGMVNEVATEPPPNDKGLITVGADLSIQGFTFTGGSDGSPDGNVAGIRLEGGNLSVSYCYFHNMQEGLLAGQDPTATVSVDHSEFANNGTGDGYTHNIYVGEVASLSITDSYFHGAVVGHEIKSRAAVTTITNNVIADGATGTASYDIDIPNAGVARITGNLIEKGPDASNAYAIHYGGETQYAFANNSLTVAGNTILNDLGASGVAVLNQSAVNGLDVSADIHDNSLYGFSTPNLLLGAGTLTDNTILSAEPGYSTASPWASAPLMAVASGPLLLNLVNSNHTITGGAAKLTVNDSGGANTIVGGSGGVNVNATGGWTEIVTAAAAADAITLTGRNCTVHSAGADHIAAPGLYEEVDATGQATITGAGFNVYNLDGGGEHLTASGGGWINVGAAGEAHVVDAGGDYLVAVAAGGRLAIADPGNTVAGALGTTASISGGAATGFISQSGAVTVTTGPLGADVQAGAGTVVVTGGAGADTLSAGSGADTFNLGAGADQVVLGSGAATVNGGSGADTYIFNAGAHGTDVITGFAPGTDLVKFNGFGPSPVAYVAVAGGSTTVTLTDGSVITFAGTVLPAGTLPATGTPAAGTVTRLAQSGAAPTLLTSGGQSITGGAALLSLTDIAGGNSVAGGAGGLSAVVAAWNDTVSTARLATDTLSLGGHDSLLSQGTDQIYVLGAGNQVTATGAANILAYAGSASSFDLEGADTLTGIGGGSVTVGAHASATITAGGNATLAITKAAGGAALITSQLAAGPASLQLSGGAATISAVGGSQPTLSAAVGAGVTVTAAGAGNVTLTGGAGHDEFVGGGGHALVSLGAYDTVVAGQGSMTVQGGTSDTFMVPLGCHGTLVVDNWSAQDSIMTARGVAAPILAQTVSGGSTWLTLQGGAQVDLVGVMHFGG